MKVNKRGFGQLSSVCAALLVSYAVMGSSNAAELSQQQVQSIQARSDRVNDILQALSAQLNRANKSKPQANLLATRLHALNDQQLAAAGDYSSLSALEGFLRGANQSAVTKSQGNGLVFVALNPCRLADSRIGAPLAANETRGYRLDGGSIQGGTCAAPSSESGAPKALALTVTATQASAGGWLTVTPNGEGGAAGSSALNFTPGVDIANSTVVAANVNGSPNDFYIASSSTTHVIVDMLGYYVDASTIQGAPGADGATGMSAYELAVNNGFVGDETAWLASLKGATGAAGPAGEAGPVGATGVAGPAGAVGPAGATGPEGPVGPTGATGAAGAPGVPGVDGKSAYALAVDKGFAGDETAWLASLKGETGAAGPTGQAGPTGAAGAAGPAGAVGPTGPAGAMGPVGPAGAVGPAGPAGVAGPTGAAGPAGPTGAVGPAGPAGAGKTYLFGGTGANLFGPNTVDNGTSAIGKSSVGSGALGDSFLIPKTGTLTALSVSLDSTLQTGRQFKFEVRIVGGGASTLTCTVTAKTCAATGTLAVNAGDAVYLQGTGSNVSGRQVAYTITYE